MVTTAKHEALLLDAAEKIINGLLRYDAATLAAMSELAGTLFAIEVAGVAQPLFIAPQAEGVRFSRAADREADVRIRGTLPDLLAMTKRHGPAKAPAGATPVEIIGNLSLMQRLDSIVKSIDIDWEELLSRRMGDIAARKVSVLARAVRGHLRAAHTTVELDVAEYLVVEKEALVSRDQMDRFLTEVDVLRAAVDRLEARIRALAARKGESRT
jgi:ubiquinone biosynthesis protein UbiJ